MRRVRGKLCRNKKGRFTKCRSGGYGKVRGGSRKKKGRCLKWSRGRSRCLKRSKR